MDLSIEWIAMCIKTPPCAFPYNKKRVPWLHSSQYVHSVDLYLDL